MREELRKADIAGIMWVAHRQMDSLAVTLSDSEVLNQPKRAQIAYPDPKTHG